MTNIDIRNTIEELKSPRGFLFAGLPKFKALFGRDSIISALELIGYDSRIGISTLNVLASLQGKEYNKITAEEPGKIIHEQQDDKTLLQTRIRDIPWLLEGRNYFSVDSTPLFIILSCDLHDNIGNSVIENQISEATYRAIEWILNNGLYGTFLSYHKAKAGMGLASQSWRDGSGEILDNLKDPISVIGVQGYAYEALERGKDLMVRTGMLSNNGDLYVRMTQAGSAIKERLDDFFFLDDLSYYALAIDGDGVARKDVTSDPGHLIGSGLLSRDREKLVIGRLFEGDIFTDYGIRCLSSTSRYFDEKAYQRGAVWPQDNFMIARGLEKRGYEKESKEIKQRIIDAIEEMQSFPEYIGVDRNGDIIPSEKMRIRACDPQAWTVGAYYHSKIQ